MHREISNGSPSTERSHSSLVKYNGKVQQAKWQNDAYETREFDDICIYQILLALFTRVAVRATILSKQWERVWPLVPVLDFDEKECNLSQKNLGGYYPHQEFVKFVTMCLQRRKNDRLLDKFRLRMCHSTCFYEHPTDSCLMDNGINFAVERNVELCISPIETSLLGRLSFNMTTTYRLPHTVLASQSITILNLECLTIKVNGDAILGFSLPSLRSLSSRNVIIDVWGFFNLQSWCPSLEIMSIIGGSIFGYQIPIEVSSSSLKYSEVIDHDWKIQVEAVNLESFRFGYKTAVSVITWMKYACDINIDSCGALIDIYNSTFKSSWFEGFRCRFPLLQSLVLYKCCISSRGCTDPIILYAPNLQTFWFSDCGALNVQSLWYRNCRHISFSMKVPNLSEAAIILDDHRDSKRVLLEEYSYMLLIPRHSSFGRRREKRSYYAHH